MSQSIKMNTPRSETTDTRSHSSANASSPSAEAKDDFDKAMAEKSKDGSTGGESEGEESGHQSGQAMPSASSLLSSLFESKMGNVTAPPPVSNEMGELVDELVQRILVSDPKSGTPTEIRLQLNDSILADTHITLQRGSDGLLGVVLTTSDSSSMQTLVAAQHTLREQLEKHGPVDVQVRSTEEAGQEGNDTNRRSRGMMDYDPENP